MYRVSMEMDWCDLERLASDIGARLVYRKCRCQHGRTRDERCIDCEGGYATDAHCFANISGQIARWNGSDCVAVSDDGQDVAYLPAKFERRILSREPIEQLKRLSRPGANTAGLERVIQRLISRLRNYRQIEMQSNVRHIGVSDVDSAAWADIAGKTPSAARPSVWFPGDGSAVTVHYRPDGLPEFHRFTRV